MTTTNDSTSGRPETLTGMLNTPGLPGFLLSSFLAFLAGNMVNFSIVLYSQVELQSPLLSGIGYFLVFGPPILFGWVAGVLCDRRPTKAVINLFQCLVMAAIGVFAYLAEQVTDRETLKTALVLIALFIGINWSFLGTARFTMVARVCGGETAKRATSLMSTSVMVALGVAPIIVTGLSNLFGWLTVFGIIIALLAISLLILLPVREAAPDRHSDRQPWFADIRESVAYLTHKRILLYWFASAAILFSIIGAMQIITPLFMDDVLQIAGAGKGGMISLIALGLIVGNLTAFKTLDRVSINALLPPITLLALACLGSFSLIRNEWLVGVGIVLIGASCGYLLNLLIANVQSHCESAIKGRILSLYTIITQIGPATGAVCSGFLVEGMGITAAVLVGSLVAGALLLIVSVLAVVRPGRPTAFTMAGDRS